MSIRKVDNRRVLAEIIGLFVKKEKQARFLEFLGSSKRYDELICGLFIDWRNLDPKCLIEVKKGEKSVKGLLTSIEKLGGGKQAFLVSQADEDSGKCLDLEDALHSVVGRGVTTLIYSIGSAAGYYENDDGIRFILYRERSEC